MSACPAPEELTSLALRHLDEAEAARLQAHVDLCPPCRKALAVWTDLLGELPLVEQPIAPPPELKRRLLGALPASADPPLLRRVSTLWVSLAATLALVLGGYSLWRVERMTPEMIALRGEGPAHGASAQVALYHEGDGTRVAITAAGLPPLTQDEVYQLWLVNGSEREAVCFFKVDATGHGETTYWLPRRITYDRLGVTREPDATYSHEPRGPKVLGS